MHCVIKMSSSIQRNLCGRARSTMTQRYWSLLLLLLNPWDALSFSSATMWGESLPKGDIRVVPWWQVLVGVVGGVVSIVMVLVALNGAGLFLSFFSFLSTPGMHFPFHLRQCGVQRSCALMTSSWWSCHSSGSCACVVMAMHRRSEWRRENR